MRTVLGEHVARPMGAAERARMEQAARQAVAAQRRREEGRRRVWGMAADTVLALAGGAAALALQGLWSGRLLGPLALAALALGCWVVAGAIREWRRR